MGFYERIKLAQMMGGKQSKFKKFIERGVKAKYRHGKSGPSVRKARKRIRDRIKRRLQRTLRKRIAKRLPVIGMASSAYFIAEDIRERGFFTAIGEAVLGAVPYVGQAMMVNDVASIVGADVEKMASAELWEAIKLGHY